METLQQLLSRIDELTLRERAIILAAVLLVLSLGWYTQLMEPLMQKEKVLLSNLDAKQRQLLLVNQQFTLLAKRQSGEPDEIDRKKLADLRSQIKLVKEDIKATAANLVPPESMPEILRLILNKSDGLTLLKLKGLGSQPLITDTATEEGNKAAAAKADKGQKENSGQELHSAYKHGMEIEFSGSFFPTLDYIKKLENLEWGFFWGQVNFKVEKYPKAVTKITLYTLSLDPDWIGT